MRVFNSEVALLALPATALAVSLSDFTPRVSNLPAECKSVYTKTINGCSGSDFGSGGCSQACVEGLQSIEAAVKSACGNKDITGQNIIVAYLAGEGPGSLCPDAASVLGGGSSSSSSADSTTSVPSSSASTSSVATVSSTQTSSDASSSTAAPTSSLTAAPTESSTSGLLVDTSSTPTSGTASSTSSSHGSSQTDDGQSGGGSPFDTSGNLASAATLSSISIGGALLAASIMLSAIIR